MATSYILTEDAPACADDADSVAAWISAETEALATALFCEVYGMDWRAAWNQAITELPDLLAYAVEWDRDACACGIVQVTR